jgi:hypothetical protein
MRAAFALCALAMTASTAAAATSVVTGELPPAAPSRPAGKQTLMLRGLEKITGRAFDIVAPLDVPVKFATLTVTARSCYSTPASETPETAAFVQIDDARPDQPERRIFSGWMYASSPGLNAVQHPLYDVWVITCKTAAPGEAAPVVASHAPVKVKSPDATDNEGLAPLPEGADQ